MTCYDSLTFQKQTKKGYVIEVFFFACTVNAILEKRCVVSFSYSYYVIEFSEQSVVSERVAKRKWSWSTSSF